MQRSLIHINQGDPAGALAALEAREPEPGAFIEAFMAYQLLTLGREEEAARMAARAIEHAEVDRSSTPYAEALMASAAIDRVRGDYPAAEERYRLAAEIAERIGNVLAACSARRWLAVVQAHRGHLEAALAEASAMLEQADRLGVFEFQASTRVVRGQIYSALGCLDEAVADFGSAVELYERLESPGLPIRWSGSATCTGNEASRLRPEAPTSERWSHTRGPGRSTMRPRRPLGWRACWSTRSPRRRKRFFGECARR